MEKMIYEGKPYVGMCLAIYAMKTAHVPLFGKLLGLLLLGCSAYIFYARARHRRYIK